MSTVNTAQGHAEDLNEPAFPIRGGVQDYQFGGMSLRDYFAAKAMAAIILNEGDWATHQLRAEFAYGQADAMLAARTTGARATIGGLSSDPSKEK